MNQKFSKAKIDWNLKDISFKICLKNLTQKDAQKKSYGKKTFSNKPILSIFWQFCHESKLSSQNTRLSKFLMCCSACQILSICVFSGQSGDTNVLVNLMKHLNSYRTERLLKATGIARSNFSLQCGAMICSEYYFCSTLIKSSFFKLIFLFCFLSKVHFLNWHNK